MIEMENGTRAYFEDECGPSTRSIAIYHVSKLGGGKPKTMVIEGALIAWPATVSAERRLDDIRAVGRMALGLDKVA